MHASSALATGRAAREDGRHARRRVRSTVGIHPLLLQSFGRCPRSSLLLLAAPTLRVHQRAQLLRLLLHQRQKISARHLRRRTERAVERAPRTSPSSDNPRAGGLLLPPSNTVGSSAPFHCSLFIAVTGCEGPTLAGRSSHSLAASSSMSGCASHTPRACSRQCPCQRRVASARGRGRGRGGGGCGGHTRCDPAAWPDRCRLLLPIQEGSSCEGSGRWRELPGASPLRRGGGGGAALRPAQGGHAQRWHADGREAHCKADVNEAQIMPRSNPDPSPDPYPGPNPKPSLALTLTLSLT